MKDYLIQKLNMECPLCDTLHQVEERKRTTKAKIKGEIVEYEEIYYVCMNVDEEENEFIPSKVMDSNLLNARNAYRSIKGLLTSFGIVAIREKYGLSQVELANLLGWGEATISRYESKAIQDDTYDKILRMIDSNPMEMMGFLNKNRSSFSFMRYMGIKEKIIRNLDDYGKEYLKRQELESEYLKYQEPSDFNGLQVLNIDKIESIVTYFALNLHSLYKVKLMKLLWYVDALSYKRNGHSITGLVYSHMPMGALPIGHYKLLGLERICVEEEYDDDGCSRFHILPCDKVNMTIFSDSEMSILNEVMTKFKYVNGQEFSSYMHEEIAYKQTQDRQEIPFSLAIQLKDF